MGEKIDPKIFRAYDVRGLYPEELNEKTAFFIGQALVRFLKKKNPKILVSRDNRLSSKPLFNSLTKGILKKGGEIVDIGLSSTPRFYFSVIKSLADAGIQITASHNPSNYNGFKLVRKKAIPISGETGLKEIKEIIEKGDFNKRVFKKEKIIKKDFFKEYIDFNFKLAGFKNFENLKSFKVVVDTANAVSGIDLKALFKKLPCQVFHLFSELDGSFPNHQPDPLLKENLKFLIREIKKRKANLGIALDGDGDRVVFVDEKGKTIRGDFITALIAKELLKEKPKEKILYEVRSSWIVRETILKNNGIPILGRAGHSLIKEKMREKNILFAGELSGHYFFREIGFFEGPLLVILEMLKILVKEKKSLSEIIKPFEIYFQSGEINFKVKDKEKKIEKIEKYYSKKAKKIIKIDGLTLEFNDWWFNLRPSNTEDLLRLNLEAKTKDILEKKTKEITSLILKI